MDFLDDFIDTYNLRDFEYEISEKLYYFGDHFKYPKAKNDLSFKNFIKSCIKLPIPQYKYKIVQSNAYFDFALQHQHKQLKIVKPLWYNPYVDSKDKLLTQMQKKLQSTELSFFLTADFLDLKKKVTNLLYSYYDENVKSLLVPFDLPFFERLSISIFQDLGRPNAVVLHGLPARYNSIDDSRADKLYVWGEEIKRNYIKAGVSEAKIEVIGHPSLSNSSRKQIIIPNNWDNILVLTKAMSGGKSDSTDFQHSNRGLLLSYIYMIERTLKKLKVKKARIRPHPSENPAWYSEMINTDFFTIDKMPLNESINCSSFLIGPASTVMINSLISGKNYYIFEPKNKNGLDLYGYKLVPPFDGSDSDFNVSHSEEQLLDNLTRKYKFNISNLEKYVSNDYSPDKIYDYIMRG